jgi:mandelate racemase
VSTLPSLTIRAIRSRAVSPPMRNPLGTSAARMTHAPFVLIDLETEEGVTGRAHVFCYMEIAAPAICRVIDKAAEGLIGKPVLPVEIERILHTNFRLLGVPGTIGMALSGIDVACWDALALAANLPLARFLGAERDQIPTYNSNGLSLGDPDALGEEALRLQAAGFDAVKIRLGRTNADDDLRAVQNVRSAIGLTALLMADYNQALTVDDAIARGKSLEDEGLAWIEEPIAHDDFSGNARVAAALETPIQIGENFHGPNAMENAIALNASDYMMPDLMRIGGVSGWLRAATMADRAGIPLSSHLYPEVSLHLLAASPTSHWLEFVDWAEPFLQQGITVENGMARVPGTPGTGVHWDEDAVAAFALD